MSMDIWKKSDIHWLTLFHSWTVTKLTSHIHAVKSRNLALSHSQKEMVQRMQAQVLAPMLDDWLPSVTVGDSKASGLHGFGMFTHTNHKIKNEINL